MIFYYNSQNENTPSLLSTQLSDYLDFANVETKTLIVLCIGSDRSTGDSLGPLIGYKLSKRNFDSAIIYGTLSSPVHAANLQDTIEHIYSAYDNPFVIAIDASLGRKEHIGYITLGKGCLKPGLGVKKKLPEVGDIHITGIVNYSNPSDNSLLQTTRLSIIMQLADTISGAIYHALKPMKIVS